jgi:hypothetical protein
MLPPHKIENMLADPRRIHTRYDRCAHTFMSAIRRHLLDVINAF